MTAGVVAELEINIIKRVWDIYVIICENLWHKEIKIISLLNFIHISEYSSSFSPKLQWNTVKE